ncbi:MAG: O2-independent ubiquinone biosynthesis accessory factor UbiT [Pseudomonadota bacterium]|nr:O2-independent ubiquinone biosynthesis accessory factor UbiT [Pseudomonadota bacterium]
MPSFFKFPPRPALPAPLAWPLKLIPGPVHSTVLTTALNVLFAGRIQESGEFEFLRDRVLAIRVRDAGVEYRFRYAGPAGFVPCQRDQVADLTITGAIYDFLALAARREDSDTLFFNRRVVMEGNTELGLELKNLLDALDPEMLGGPLPSLLRVANQCLATYERLSD